jgi:arylsulfatase A-like enzyme
MTPFYEMSTKIPLILVPTRRDERLRPGSTDDRLAEFGDIMPTLLDLCGLPIPPGVDRQSLAGDQRRDALYGEHGEGTAAMRMIRAGRYKLIYYPVGNQTQLFDLANDPYECLDLAGDAGHAEAYEHLTRRLIDHLYGADREWVRDGMLRGLPDEGYVPAPDRNLRGQRGLRFL